jgi:hypothetical protein
MPRSSIELISKRNLIQYQIVNGEKETSRFASQINLCNDTKIIFITIFSRLDFPIHL